MANKNVELMRGEPEKAVKKMAIPVMIAIILTASYNIVDGFWIAGLGPAAIAGIGFVTPIFALINGVSVGLGSGATSSISRAVGAKDRNKASKAALHSLLIFFIASVLLTIILLLIQEPLLKTYGASGESLAEGMRYGSVLFLGLFAFMFANGAGGILRGEGDMKRAMYAMFVSTILNFFLDPIFIYSLNLGTPGAALATITSTLGSAIVIMYWILVKKDTYVNVSFKNFKFDSIIFKDILKVGIPASFETLITTFSVSLYLIFISSIAGDLGVAAYTSGQRLYLFAVLPLSAIGIAVSAVSGSSFGAENWEYLSRTHTYGTKFATFFGVLFTAILVIFAPYLALIFAHTADTAVLLPEITSFLQVASLGLLFEGIAKPSSFMYQGIGRGSTSLAWTILREIVSCVSLTYVFAFEFGWGLIGIWIGLACGRMFAAILNYIYAKYAIRQLKAQSN